MTMTPDQFAAAFAPTAQTLESASSERAETLQQMLELLPTVLLQAIDGDETASKRAGRFICALGNPHLNVSV